MNLQASAQPARGVAASAERVGHRRGPATSTRTLTFWSDIGCPWATLALETLHAAAERRQLRLLVDHRAFPLELFNKRSTPKPILDAEIVAIGARRPELDWRAWDRPEWTYPVTTLPALEAVQAAKDPAVGGLVASTELDLALRGAFYRDRRCVSVHAEIIDVAKGCDEVDAAALQVALAAGHGRAQVYADWTEAAGVRIQGSPTLLTSDGYSAHNPGVAYRWTAAPGEGFPLFESYDEGWTEPLLDRLASPMSPPLAR